MSVVGGMARDCLFFNPFLERKKGKGWWGEGEEDVGKGGDIPHLAEHVGLGFAGWRDW